MKQTLLAAAAGTALGIGVLLAGAHLNAPDAPSIDAGTPDMQAPAAPPTGSCFKRVHGHIVPCD